MLGLTGVSRPGTLLRSFFILRTLPLNRVCSIGVSTPQLSQQKVTCSLHVQDFNIEKLQLLESEKAKIRKEYERREGQIEVKKKM